MNWYGWLKVVHVLSAIVWIGGGAALMVVLLRLTQSRDRATLKAFVPQVSRYMGSIGGPSSGILLLTGIAMVLVAHMTFKSLWISLGILGVIALGAFGGLVMAKRVVALEQAVATGDDTSLAAAGSKVRQGAIIVLSIMAAVVVIMVLKPTI